MLGQSVDQRQKAPLRVKPRVRAELAIVRLQAFDDARYTELEVAFCAVQRTNHEVDNAEVEDLLVWVLIRQLLLLLLYLSHQLFRLLILRSHDVRHAQVGQNDGLDRQDIVFVLAHDRAVVADSLLVPPFLLHEEDMSHVELPRVVFGAELCRLSEYFFHHGVVLHVPVDLRHRHQHGDIPLKPLVVLLQRPLDRVAIFDSARVLNVLRQLAEGLHIALRKLVVLPVRLLGGRLQHDGGVQKVVQVLRQVLVCKMGIFCKEVGREVIQLVLAVEEKQVAEGLGGEGRISKKMGELFEARVGVVFHLHEGLVVQSDGVHLLLRAGRHVGQRFFRSFVVFHHVLDVRLQVESLDEGAFAEGVGVANTPHVQAVVVATHRQLWVLSHSLLDDLRDVLQRRPVLLHAVVAQRDVVGEVGLVRQHVHRILKVLESLLVLALLVVHAAAIHDGVRVGSALLEVGAAGSVVFLLVLDAALQLEYLVGELR
mmetsp:Transcript_46997/g.121339  ORF Transcript_46997/g.121339 Transcript_46997/m.121339 type:complete len:483 (+) Transcript_46997:579-2027(+)